MPNPNGAVAGNAQNVPVAHVPRSRSTFPLAYEFPHSDRFGEYVPHLAEDVNKDEVFPIRSSHEIRSYTMKSPLMQNVRRNKDYFFVPSMAILPNNWDKFFDHPVRGDDVLDDVGPTVSNFWSKVSSLLVSLYSALQTILSASATTNEVALQSLLRYLIIGEYFYSNGNLLAYLNCHGAPYVVVNRASSNPGTISWDRYFDIWMSEIIRLVDSFSLSVDGNIYQVSSKAESMPGLDTISWHHALSLLRDNPTGVVSSVNLTADATTLKTDFVNFQTASFGSITFSNASVPCKFEKLWAYQLVISHYFTNDHIDFIYSATLYRELIGSYVRTALGSSFNTNATFTMNSVVYFYDWCSAHFFDILVSLQTSGSNPQGLLNSVAAGASWAYLGYLSALFGFRRSLRYLDYFTGSRAQALAVQGSNTQMNTNVAVVNNAVSVLDITKKIQAQRFRNSVNRVRQQAESYLKGIFGGSMPAPDYHNPFYLAHTSDVIYGQETENTGSAQLAPSGSSESSLPIAITTNLRGTSGNYVFEAHTDRPGIIIGITSYDITRIYTKSIDRSFFHISRYDWFNPFLQYIGDQEVWLQELGIKPAANSLNNMTPFAYALRHMEYKQRYSYAAGAFCEEGILPGWIFVASDRRGNQATINPDWIRSVPAEFDRFYISLSGYSLATYFHFIVKDFNSTNASRPMAYSPQILG